MTTKLNQIFANLKAAIMDIKKMEGDTNKIDSFNEVNKIGELLANAEMEIGDVLEKERADLQKQADKLPHSQYVKKENELNSIAQTAGSKIEELQSAVEDEKEAMKEALPEYQYYDKDGQIKDINGLYKVYPNGGYEVKKKSMADGSYTVSMYDVNGIEYALKVYNEDRTPCTDKKKAAECLGLKPDGFFNTLKSILVPFTEIEYTDKFGTNYRWDEVVAQFNSPACPSRTKGLELMRAYTLDDVVESIGSQKEAWQISEERRAKDELQVAERARQVEERKSLIYEAMKEAYKNSIHFHDTDKILEYFQEDVQRLLEGLNETEFQAIMNEFSSNADQLEGRLIEAKEKYELEQARGQGIEKYIVSSYAVHDIYMLLDKIAEARSEME